MSDVRTQIQDIIWNTYAAGHNDASAGKERDVAMFMFVTADRIIGLVREAMLSDAAVTAGAVEVAKPPDKWGYEIILNAYRGVLREGVEVMCDTAFSPASDQHGEGAG